MIVTKKISDVAIVFNGKTPSKKEQREQGHPVLKIKDIDEFGRFKGFTSFVDDEFAARHNKKAVFLGDTLLLNAAHNSKYVGSKNTFILDEELNGVIVTGEWTIIRPKDNINSRYLNLFITSGQGRHLISSIVKGIHLYPKDVLRLPIPLPPLDQQKKIAAILDTADAYRQKTKALIEKYDQLTQSLFLEMFGDPVSNPRGWESKSLGNLLEITSSKRIFKDEYVEHGIPFYRTKEIVELSRGKEISLELFISESRYDEIKSKYELPKIGDILLSAVGTIGVMWTVDTEEPFYFKDGNLVWLKSSALTDVNPVYLRMTLEHLIEYEKYKLAEGGAYNALTIAKLKEFDVLLAPFELQKLFADRLKAIKAQKAIAQQELDKADELFNSLLQRAFKGELV